MSERDLWASVLLQAFRDATRVLTPGSRKDDIGEKRIADRWIRRGGKNFGEVCSLAGFEPSAVRAAYTSGRFDAEIFGVGKTTKQVDGIKRHKAAISAAQPKAAKKRLTGNPDAALASAGLKMGVTV